MDRDTTPGSTSAFAARRGAGFRTFMHEEEDSPSKIIGMAGCR